jgi:hypothetical protein
MSTGRDLVLRLAMEISASDRETEYWRPVGLSMPTWAACSRAGCPSDLVGHRTRIDP